MNYENHGSYRHLKIFMNNVSVSCKCCDTCIAVTVPLEYSYLVSLWSYHRSHLIYYLYLSNNNNNYVLIYYLYLSNNNNNYVFCACNKHRHCLTHLLPVERIYLM